ncbi:MAG: N-acetylmuramoyl-L-alanine amidase [Lachnospiraceae bacterium]|nr:N-acetylmuramoyl-L-alanine amidase [Lachnospiraceae bacterium]
MQISKKIRRIAALLAALMVVLTACGNKPTDDDIDYYKRVGEYAEPTEGLYVATGKDLPGAELTPGGQKEATPTPAEPKFIVVLDPGHGGKWDGAVYSGRREKDLNLKHAIMLKDYLESHYSNVEVYLTRSDDTTFSDSLSDDLRMRVEFGVKKKADILISMHLNATEYHDAAGAMVCISKQQNITDKSAQLANCILEHLSTLGIRNRGPYKRDSTDMTDDNGVPLDYYAIVRHGASNNLISVILESCYMDIETDAQHIATDEAMSELSAQEAMGIMDFLTNYYSK